MCAWTPQSTFFWLASILLIAGCGRSPWERQPVRGTVTLDEQMAPDAGLMFLPAGETRGPAVTGVVRGGSYEFSRETGPVAGEHEVRLLLSPEKTADGGASREDSLPSVSVEVPGARPYDLNLTFVSP